MREGADPAPSPLSIGGVPLRGEADHDGSTTHAALHEAPRPIEGPVAVVGLGVMGASLARALRGADPTLRILGIEPDPRVGISARNDGVVDAFDPSGEALLPEARTVVFAAPLSALPPFLATARGALASDALLTDVVGMNAPVLRAAAAAGVGGRWVSGAPNLVTPEAGYGAGREDLFRGVEVRLSVEGDGAEEEGAPFRARAEALWAGVGASTFWMDPREHDALVAWTLLLPRLLAGGLAGALHAAGVPSASLPEPARAMVALAGTDPARWNDLLEAGAPIAGTGITSVNRAMNVVADLLAGRHVERVAEFLERARGWVAEGEGVTPPGAMSGPAVETLTAPGEGDAEDPGRPRDHGAPEGAVAMEGP